MRTISNCLLIVFIGILLSSCGGGGKTNSGSQSCIDWGCDSTSSTGSTGSTTGSSTTTSSSYSLCTNFTGTAYSSSSTLSSSQSIYSSSGYTCINSGCSLTGITGYCSYAYGSASQTDVYAPGASSCPSSSSSYTWHSIASSSGSASGYGSCSASGTSTTTTPTTTTTTTSSGTLTLKIKSLCSSLSPVSYKFYDFTNNSVWPSSSTHYVADYNVSYSKIISCTSGATICVGGSPPSGAGSWGVGLDGTQSCTSCCYTCDGGTATYNFGC